MHEFRIESDHASSKQAAGDGVIAGDVRVLIVSGHALTRYGLSVALNDQPGVDVVAEADNPAEAMKLAGELRPDVVVLDTVHAGRRAAQITRLLLNRPAAEAPAILIVANKVCDCSPVVMLAGAQGLLLKDAQPADLAGAIRSVASGYVVVPSGLARCLCLPDRQPPQACDPSRLQALSERELEVLHRMVTGKSNAEIAADLHIGEGTVKSHVQRVLSKLGVKDRVRAVIYAYDAGFVERRGAAQTIPVSTAIPVMISKRAS
ncbi:MAG TPA: response regulator transcription factor [Streptosporangiaceae bacterium]|nr:response regulator transcription factor [Streptosporangiaceae bacterium]